MTGPLLLDTLSRGMRSALGMGSAVIYPPSPGLTPHSREWAVKGRNARRFCGGLPFTVCPGCAIPGERRGYILQSRPLSLDRERAGDRVDPTYIKGKETEVWIMKRPLAYVTAAWRGGECEVMEQAAKYCRIVYDAGYSPICPMLYLPLFLNDAVPEEHKSGIDMGRDLLRRSRVLVVCGSHVDEAVKNDIAVAQRLGITATTLDGILTVKGQRRR